MKINIEKIKTLMPGLAKKNGLDLVLLFGSQASGKTHSQSDTDFAVRSDRVLGPAELAAIQMQFSQLFGIGDLEVADLKTAPYLLLRKIAENSLLLYEKEERSFARFRIYAFKRHMEAKRFRQLRAFKLERFIKQNV